MANPALSKRFGELPAVGASADAAPQTPPISPITSEGGVMTIGGTAAKMGVLLLLVCGACSWGT